MSASWPPLSIRLRATHVHEARRPAVHLVRYAAAGADEVEA